MAQAVPGGAAAGDDTAAGARLSNWHKFAYGVGGVSSGMKAQALGVYVIPYYVVVMGLDPRLAGFAIMASRIWDAVTDPLVGQWSDRSRHGLGRRRAFMLASAVPFALCFWAMWAAPRGLSQGALAAYLAAMYIALYTMSTVFTVPYYALGAELSPDYDERTSVTGWRTVFYNVGALVGGLLPAALMYRQDKTPPFGLSEHAAWSWLGLTFAGILLVACLVPFLFTREPPMAVEEGTHPPILESIRTTLTNRPFLILLTSTSIKNFGWAIVGALIVITAEYWLDARAHIKYFLVTQIIFGLASIPIWVRLSAFTSKLTAYRTVLNMMSLVFITAYWMHPDRLWLTYLLMGLGGAGVAGNAILSTSLLADICDLDELQTGHRREANFFAVQWFLTKFPAALGAGFVGIALGFFEFVPDGEQSVYAIEGIRVVFGPTVAFCFAVAALAFRWFPLTREEHQRLRLQLQARREGDSAAA